MHINQIELCDRIYQQVDLAQHGSSPILPYDSRSAQMLSSWMCVHGDVRAVILNTIRPLATNDFSAAVDGVQSIMRSLLSIKRYIDEFD